MLGILLIPTLKKLFVSTKEIVTISSGCTSISFKNNKIQIEKKLVYLDIN